jgi:hypothetical protein
VIELAYVNGTIWQENDGKLWWGETQPNAAWAPAAGTAISPLPATTTPTPTTTPAPTITPSGNNTVVLKGSAAAIVDATGNKWTITPGGQVAINGTIDTTTSGVIELAYVNGTIWQENGNKLWWGETQPNAAWAPAAGTATSPLLPSTTPRPTPVPASANNTVVLKGSTAAIIDATGNKWTITAAGQVAINGTADTTTSGVIELAYVNGTIWQENGNKLWWGETQPNAAWAPAAGTAISPLPSGVIPDPTSAPTSTGPGTRDPSQTPFASTSIFNLPIGSGAQWMANSQLTNSKIFVNTVGNFNQNIYAGSASDRLVTVTNNAQMGGTPGTFQVHIPAGAVPAAGGDAALSIDDTATHTWYSFGGFQWTGNNTATARQGSGESDFGSGMTVANSNWDQGVGTLRQHDLTAGTIDHMLRIQMPTQMLMSFSSSVQQLAPYAWPQTEEDGFAINGNGGTPYSGTIPFGVTIGIPSTAIEPSAVAANAGANMLWHALREHGAMVRDSAGSGNTVTFQADQNVNQNDPLIQGIEQFGAQIMAQTKILANQGPNSINGGGTPIVPLDPEPNDAPKAAAAITGIVPPERITIAAGTTSATVTQSQVSVVATSGNHMLFISGSGDNVSLSGGANTITDTGTGNTYILPAAGNGTDTFTSNILTTGDTLDLRTALAATDWTGSTSTLSNYLKVTDSASGGTLSIAPTSGGIGVVIANINGASNASLTSVLAHSIT